MTTRELHDNAISLMRKAELISNSNKELAKNIYLEAAELEARAAVLIELKEENEPTRSILYLAAASLFWRAEAYVAAERLACQGLGGFPPASVKNDLFKLLDEIKYAQTYQEKKTTIEEAELDVRLYGDHVRHGAAPLPAVIDRLINIYHLCVRTFQRMAGAPYADMRKKNDLIIPYSAQIAVTAPGSFGLKMKLTREIGKFIPLIDCPPQQILDDVLKNIDLYAQGGVDDVQKNIPDEDYRTHFLAHAKEIIPDGKKIRLVGLATRNNCIELSTTKAQVKEFYKPKPSTTEEVYISIRGFLDEASRKKKTLLFTKESDGTEITVNVKAGLEEVARKYFGYLVDASFERKGKKTLLVEIQSIEDDDIDEN
jgi:hypothetical protein